MVKYSAGLDATFAALSDPTRRAILARLALGESSVTELAAPFDVSLPAISKHLKVLEGAGLLVRERDGRVHRCRLEAAPMRQAAGWIEHYRRFWEAQFDALERYLEKTSQEKGKRKEKKRWRRKAAQPRRSKSGERSGRRERRSSRRGRSRRR
jgi:DNA-binding transcriptional ArsR family regulator